MSSRSSAWKTTLGAAIAGLMLIAPAACGPRVPAARPLPGTIDNTDRPLLPGERIQLLEAPGHPTLQLIRRSGDPSGAVGLSIFPPGGSAESLQLAALVKSRLDEAGWRNLTMEVHSAGVLVAREVNTADDVKRWMKDVHGALTRSVTKSEADRLNASGYLRAARARTISASPFGSCLAQLGAEGREPIDEALLELKDGKTHEILERIRRNSAVASRVGLSALGEPALVDAAAEAHDLEWPGGDPIDDSWTERQQLAVIEAEGGREVRVAVRLADSEAALAGARALQADDHPLHARLHALDSELSVSRTEVTLRPAGACAGLTIALGSDGRAPKAEKISAIALLATHELEASVRQSLTDDERTFALLAPEGALEAAGLAAWTAVRSARTGGGMQQIVEYRTPPGENLPQRALEAAIKETEIEWSKRDLPVMTADESGQAELWLLVASSCGTAPETPEDMGLRALTVSSLAATFSGGRGVTLEPYVSPSAVGLLAHAPPLPGESSLRHSQRVARAAASALAGAPLDGRAVAAMRSRQLDRVGSDPGAELMLSVLGAGYPSLLEPWGDAKTVATFSVADAERTREDLVQEPLRIAVLTSAEPAQGRAVAAALSEWLAPSRAHPTTCPVRKPEPADPGLWTLETIDEEVKPGAFIGVFAPTERTIGKATEFLLNRPGGYLDRAFSEPGLVAHVEARWLGGETFGALALRVAAEPHLLEPAVQQARAVLSALAEGNMPGADANLAAQRFTNLERDAMRSQRARLVRLFHEGETPPSAAAAKITPAALRDFHRKLGADTHRVIMVKVRK